MHVAWFQLLPVYENALHMCVHRARCFQSQRDCARSRARPRLQIAARLIRELSASNYFDEEDRNACFNAIPLGPGDGGTDMGYGKIIRRIRSGSPWRVARRYIALSTITPPRSGAYRELSLPTRYPTRSLRAGTRLLMQPLSCTPLTTSPRSSSRD